MILDLLKNDGFEPKRKTADEYCTSCPVCGGRDRFLVWPETDRWHCLRGCGVHGDSIQYLRDFHNLSFQDAADQVGKIIPDRRQKITSARARVKPARKKPEPPTADWSTMAGKLVDYAHENLMNDQVKLSWLESERGLTAETVKRFKLGWLHDNHYRDRKEWGLEGEKKLFIPSGLVIPLIDSERTLRVQIRRDKPGEYGRYYVLPGSSSQPMIINQFKPCPESDPAIVTESGLDAILLNQEIRNSFTIVALGSAQIRPDEELAEILSRVPFIFVALDSDEAGGKQAVSYWLKTFDNAVRMPIPKQFGKDPTEALLNGLDLNLWLSAAYKLVIDLGGNLNTQTLLQ
jgi:hypothetical protein